MKLIGLAGYKRSGKNTVGDLIAESYPVGHVKCVGLADKLKVAGARALGFYGGDARLIEIMDEFKEHGVISLEDPGGHYASITGREFLQYLGTEVGREMFGDEFWLDLVLPRPAEHVPGMVSEDHRILNQRQLKLRYGVDILVVTDVRFDNEAQRILDLGGQIWEVHRPDVVPSIARHHSEEPIDRRFIGATIDNSSDLDSLKFNVKEALKCL